MYPSPSSIVSIPSTNIRSFGANWGVVNPKTGVSKTQVTIPALLLLILLIPIPLELLIKTTLCGSESKPNIGAIWSILVTEPVEALAIKDEESTILLVDWLKSNALGSVR